MNKQFNHLHVHSEYSLLDGLSKIKNIVKKAKEFESSAIALTDHGVMYGAIEFYKEAKKQGIKPIIGCEAYVIDGDHKDKNQKGEINHLLLLAKNYEGYKNLMKISSIAHLEGFYYKPRISKSTLAKYAKGIIATSGCPKGEIAQLIQANDIDKAKKSIEWYQEIFGSENYYLEVQRHFYKDYFALAKKEPKILEKLESMQKTEDNWVQNIVKLSRSMGIPIVATNDAHYISKEDATAQDALVCISTGKNVSDIERLRYIDTPTFYLKSPQEMYEDFSDLPDACQNTQDIADQVDIEIELGKWHFPHIPLPQNTTAEDHLKNLSYERLPQRVKDVNSEVKERLEYELKVICDKGYAPYFLLMSTLVNWCTDQGIITNTRGSAAGSLVSYVLGITTVDPLLYNLPFERFLNPFRPSPPDIDLDIADDRREELITHVSEMFGRDKVAQICTFGRMMARAAVRDVGRVLGYPYSVPDRVSKTIPLGAQGFPMTIDKALSTTPELKTMYDSETDTKKILDLAKGIEGNARHISVHAAGNVVSPEDMTDYSPLQLEPNGTKIITQYEMHACEDVGLVKFDILGIRNLSILGSARDIVQEMRGIKLDLNHIPIDDKKTFSLLSKGETMGVFQLGSSGMIKWLKELRPTRIEDIMIMIALYRPGPMNNIQEFILRKNKSKKVVYDHPKMAKFLDKSMGVLVYQDDLLYTALEIAGYDWGSVDKFRKAVGKKIPEEMAKQHEIFVEGCIKHSNMSKQDAEKLWDLFVPFQGYGFNKAHAASYGVVSYQTAYVKANFPVEYMTALLTAESGNTDKIVEAIDECKRMKIKVLPPKINSSEKIFTIVKDESSLDGRAIRFGLSAIKNVGDVAIDIILKARVSGPFKSLSNFCQRVDSQKVNKKVLESLIQSGALDDFGKRSAMLAVLDKIRESGMSISKAKNLGQFSMFETDDQSESETDSLPDIEEMDKKTRLNLEKDLLGFYLTEHPLGDKIIELRKNVEYTVLALHSEGVRTGTYVTTGGIIESVRNVTTKANNQQMCFAKMSDQGKFVEVVVFPKAFALNPGLWQVDKLVMLRGKLEQKGSKETPEDDAQAVVEQDLSIVVDSAVEYEGFDTVLPSSSSVNSYNNPVKNIVSPVPPINKIHSIYIPKNTSQSKLVELNTLLSAHKGKDQVELIFENGNQARTIPLPYGLKWNDELRLGIQSLLQS